MLGELVITTCKLECSESYDLDHVIAEPPDQCQIHLDIKIGANSQTEDMEQL